MLQRSLSDNKGLDGSASNALSASVGCNFPHPENSDSNLFAKQLAALAQKSTIGKMGPKGAPSNGASSSCEMTSDLTDPSSKRSSSILDPKARALPSASLPKKAPTIAPNLSKARTFTPARSSTFGEQGGSSSEGTLGNSSYHVASSIPSLQQVTYPGSDSIAAIASHQNAQSDIVDLTDANDIDTSSSGTASNPGQSGLFDNISLESQLEGFASGSTEGKEKTAGSLKDLLKPANGTNTTFSLTPRWNNDPISGLDKTHSNHAWSNFAGWNASSWNNGASNQGGWQWSNQPVEQEQLAQGDSQLVNQSSMFGNSQISQSVDTSSSLQSYPHYSENYRTDQWSNFNNIPSSSTASTNSTAYPPHSQYANNFYPSSHYDYNSGSFNSFTPSTQNEFTPVANFPNFSGHANNSYTPTFSQPYPGSFSQ